MTKEELTLELLGKTIYVISYIPSPSSLFSSLANGIKVDPEDYLKDYVVVGFRMQPSYDEFRIMVSQKSSYKKEDFDFHANTTTWDLGTLKDCFTSKEEALKAVKARFNETLQKIKLTSANLQSF